MEEACLMGFSEGSEQGKLGTALLQAQLPSCISAFFLPVNLKTVCRTICYQGHRIVFTERKSSISCSRALRLIRSEFATSCERRSILLEAVFGKSRLNWEVQSV